MSDSINLFDMPGANLFPLRGGSAWPCSVPTLENQKLKKERAQNKLEKKKWKPALVPLSPILRILGSNS